MKICLFCSEENLENIEETNHLFCSACGAVILHQGNGFIVEI